MAVNKVFGVYANASKMVKVGSLDSVFRNNFRFYPSLVEMS